MDNSLGGEAESEDLKLQINEELSGEKIEKIPVIPNNDYVITEELPLPEGYELVGFDGDCNDMGEVIYSTGEQKTCIVINKFTEVPTSGDSRLLCSKYYQ